jgi:hypothetical protein
MKNGDMIIDYNDKVWILVNIDKNIDNEEFLLVFDFKTQKESYVLLQNEVKEVVPKPLNIEFMIFSKREKKLADIKGYL